MRCLQADARGQVDRRTTVPGIRPDRVHAYSLNTGKGMAIRRNDHLSALMHPLRPSASDSNGSEINESRYSRR